MSYDTRQKSEKREKETKPLLDVCIACKQADLTVG